MDMIKYAKVINSETGLCEIGLGTNIAFYQSIGMAQLDVAQSDIDGCWYITEKCPMKTDEQKEKEEQIRISKLSCTKRVLVLMLEQLGFDYYEQILPLIENNRQAKLEWELCERLERNNPLIDVVGEQLGISPEQIDKMFKYANGEITSLTNSEV